MIRGLLDTVLGCPGARPPTPRSTCGVAAHLERTHHGLKDVKDRLLEYLAVCRLRADAAADPEEHGSRAKTAGGHTRRAGAGARGARAPSAGASDQPATILCLAGPPGTGTSSVAQSIAEA